jgi:diketogulonate reductase-like aldo/keto reductase
MPRIALGTCCGRYWIEEWIRQGGCHLDTAVDYGSHPEIATAVAASISQGNNTRKDFFITSKLDNEDYGPDMMPAFQAKVLDTLKMDYVDLILLHFSGPHEGTYNNSCFEPDNKENGTWYKCRVQACQSLESIVQTGKARAWGVSNWGKRELEQLYQATGLRPQVNQIEFHPYYHTDIDLLQVATTVQYCQDNGIAITSYAPNGAYPRLPMLDDPAVQALAKKYGRTGGEIAQSWILNRLGPKSTIASRSKTASHQEVNLRLLDWVMTADEMASLDHLKQEKIYGNVCQPWC